MASPSRDTTVYNFNVVRWLEKHHRKKKISKPALDAAKIVELRGIFEALDDDDSGSKASFMRRVFIPILPQRSSRLCLCSPPTRVPTRTASVRTSPTRNVLSVSVDHPSFMALVRVRFPPAYFAAKRSSPRSVVPLPILRTPSSCSC